MNGIKRRALLAALVAIVGLLMAGCAATDKGNQAAAAEETVAITNVSYDPTREFYTQYNQLFSDFYAGENGRTVTVTQSHGGSGSQALSVSQGLEADVVTLALEADVQAIADAGLIEAGWADEFEGRSAPYTSTIVFLVREGNPKNIRDWDDLTRDDVGVITPNPKTSGGARWNFLAAWAFAEQLYDGDEAQIKTFMGKLFANVLVLDSGARGSTTSFVENGQGDVLLAWENEAFLTRKQSENYEIVTPSISILCQPTVAVVDEVVARRDTADVAQAYLLHLYSDEAQHLAAQHFYRPSSADILSQYADQFDLDITLTTIEHFGGWSSAQQVYFADGGVFDQIYEK